MYTRKVTREIVVAILVDKEYEDIAVKLKYVYTTKLVLGNSMLSACVPQVDWMINSFFFGKCSLPLTNDAKYLVIGIVNQMIGL